jgi:hypothetical protein
MGATRGKYRNVGGFRPTFDWESESKEEVKLGASIKNVSATLRRQSQEVQTHTLNLKPQTLHPSDP